MYYYATNMGYLSALSYEPGAAFNGWLHDHVIVAAFASRRRGFHDYMGLG